MNNKKIILRLQEVFERLDLGVLEYWSVGVMADRSKFFLQYSRTPSLQYLEINYY